MQTSSPLVFQVHREGGREPALTIIGSEAAFEKLAYRINDTLNARREANSHWGDVIATCEVSEIGIPNSTVGLTFAINNETWATKKSWRPAFGSVWSTALGITGVGAIGYMLVRVWL